MPGDYGASCGYRLQKAVILESERSKIISNYTATQESAPSPWMEHIASQLSSTQSVLRACLSWVFELGIAPEMSFYQKKNLALINTAAFGSLLMAMPMTFMLILMGFGHPFSLLISSVLWACLILGFNGAQRVEWSKALFAFMPGVLIMVYSLLELSSNGLDQPLNYLLARQGVCFALLLPVIIYGFESRQKVAGVAGVCGLIFLGYDVGSMQLGAFHQQEIMGLSHGLFTVISLLQFAGFSACVLYTQNYTIGHARHTEQANEKLKSLAIRDGLTGLFNHSFMVQMIGDAINRARRSGTPLALLMIDVDFFKQVNDNLGHNAGDEVLVKLTRLLNSNKRSTDYLGRWGGDELLMLLTDTKLSGAYNLAEKLRGLVENEVFPHGKHLTVSLGASEYQDGDTPASLIARADAALYRAKRSGRNKVERRESSV
jgi:diguanylate cyclase (GGDEF)-like protein